ncbi:hypothetical protein LTR53_008249 [Teratosphaeriaceae sp. CCFEE 6253]|nr:hypothetical protein LTR53_008249 [Teratosphaeriaceae sp. CCFEE 6253]
MGSAVCTLDPPHGDSATLMSAVDSPPLAADGTMQELKRLGLAADALLDKPAQKDHTDINRQDSYATSSVIDLTLSILHLTSPKTAAKRVLRTTELLEQILLWVGSYPVYAPSQHRIASLLTLLLSQRVCVKFRDVIEGSSKLCKTLYFEPSDNPDFHVINPLLVRNLVPAYNNSTWRKELGVHPMKGARLSGGGGKAVG